MITVTITDDAIDSKGDRSLREAIIAANTNVPKDGCPAGSGLRADTIELVAGAVPDSPGAYRARLILVHDDGSRELESLEFATGTHDFEEQTKTITASEPYRKVLIEIGYGKPSGTARFDDVSVTIEP